MVFSLSVLWGLCMYASCVCVCVCVREVSLWDLEPTRGFFLMVSRRCFMHVFLVCVCIHIYIYIYICMRFRLA